MLNERAVDFTHGYRMRCEACQASNWLTAEAYAGTPDSMMTCSACGDAYNFGPRVIDLRDAEDPALDDDTLTQFAWYHTTTDPEWPRAAKPLENDEIRHLRERAGFSEEQIDRRRRIHENQALHLGTYEAAVESMLRRMRNQNDQHSTFFLHRVRLRPNVVVEAGWRDENSAEAAKITSSDLSSRGVEAIRYLNAYESIGSLSLAVVRGAIESTQRVPLPVPELDGPPDASVVQQLRAFRDDLDALLASPLEPPLTPLAKLQRQASARRGVTVLPSGVWKVATKMSDFAADRYVVGVSSVVRDDFLRSVHRPAPEADYEKDLQWLTRFIGLAALLTRPENVQRVLALQTSQRVSPT